MLSVLSRCRYLRCYLIPGIDNRSGFLWDVIVQNVMGAKTPCFSDCLCPVRVITSVQSRRGQRAGYFDNQDGIARIRLAVLSWSARFQRHARVWKSGTTKDSRKSQETLRRKSLERLLFVVFFSPTTDLLAILMRRWLTLSWPSSPGPYKDLNHDWCVPMAASVRKPRPVLSVLRVRSIFSVASLVQWRMQLHDE